MVTFPHIGPLRLRLVLALLAALLIVFLFESVPALRTMIEPLQAGTAMLAFVAVKAAGLPIAIDDILLSHPTGFRVAISYGCTPLVPAIFLGSVLTLGLSLQWRERLIALTSSIALITILNLLRVCALYYIGAYSPSAFVFAHEWLGQGVIVLGTAILACYWIRVSVRVRAQPPAV